VDGEHGGIGLLAYSAGRLHVVGSTMRGGRGADTSLWPMSSGNGGDGTRLQNTSFLRIVGGASNAGLGGLCNAPQCTTCAFFGVPGYGIFISDTSSLFHSASTQAFGGSYLFGPNCITLGTWGLAGANQFLIAPDDPVLVVSGTPLPGQVISFTLSGPPGAPATLWLGRGLIVNPTPPVAIEQLVPHARVFQLGPIPASGVVSRSFVIPPMPIGAGFAAQAEVVLQGGETRRTNSCPVIVR
jgi:hypothetical protein